MVWRDSATGMSQMNGQQHETIIQCMDHSRTYKDAETLIQILPHAAFDRVLGAGYRIDSASVPTNTCRMKPGWTLRC